MSDERQLAWSELPPSLRAMVVLVIADVIVLVTALYLAIGGDGSGRIGDLARDVLGRGEVRSEAWLRVAWLMPLAIAVTLVLAWRMGARQLSCRAGGDSASSRREGTGR